MVVEAIKEVKSKTVMIFGANGMLGHALREIFPGAMPLTHADADITDEGAVRKVILGEKPFAVINAAAFTDVDGCEDREEYANAINGLAPGYLAAACAGTGSILIHYSTDYIFDGSRMDYREDDLPHPLNAYGRSKLLGEELIQKNMKDFRIIRTSWLFGEHGKNFVDTVLTLSRQMPQVKVVSDQIGKPTYTVDLAKKTPEIISREPGIYHITNSGICSWYKFAEAFIPNAVPCSTADFPRKAKRPVYSVLVNSKTPPLRHWSEAVKEYILQKKGDLK